jgi:hypothetical protein
MNDSNGGESSSREPDVDRDATDADTDADDDDEVVTGMVVVGVAVRVVSTFNAAETDVVDEPDTGVDALAPILRDFLGIRIDLYMSASLCSLTAW